MITKKTQPMYYVGEQSFQTLGEAQKCEIMNLLPDPVANLTRENIPEWMITNREAIVDILTTTATSKPKARKVHGGTKVRKAKVEVV